MRAVLLGYFAAAASPSTWALKCNAGKYFDGDMCSICPGGTFGAIPGLTSSLCSELCEPGYYCSAGSTSPQQNPCGSSNFYCPTGSAQPVPVEDGYYTVASSAPTADVPTAMTNINAGERIRCDKGYYCVLGVRYACPAGLFGDSTRVTTAACSAKCPKGSYCPAATNVPIPCPPGTYGGKHGLATPQCSGPCPIGNYCTIGTVVPVPCPAGTFGGVSGLTTQACSSTCSIIAGTSLCIPSLCPAGFYCSVGAAIPTECGSPAVYCPEGSPLPTTASQGYYTTWKAYSGIFMTGAPMEMLYVDGGELAVQNQNTRSNQHICEKGSYCVGGVKKFCPAGTYGNQQGLYSAACTASCPAGYFCPVGTVDYTLFPCTARSVFCRQGSPVPRAVDTGYFTVPSATGLRIDETICPRGSYCIGGVKNLCPEGTYGATTGLASNDCSGKCQDGYVCPRRSILATQSPCPAGSYSQNGKICAPCSPGYWCGVASPNPRQHVCGGDAFYCPLGSSAAQSVYEGYYSVGQQPNTHTSEAFCVVRNAPHLPQCPS